MIVLIYDPILGTILSTKMITSFDEILLGMLLVEMNISSKIAFKKIIMNIVKATKELIECSEKKKKNILKHSIRWLEWDVFRECVWQWFLFQINYRLP